MSGIGELMYTLLLGWMRALFDAFWSALSGNGSGGLWQWLLNNWKVWVVVLVVGGLAVDWIMWLVRWRPHRLLFGKKIKPEAALEDEALYADEGAYYAPRQAFDAEAADWTDMTLGALSEVDPGWAGDVTVAEGGRYAPQQAYAQDEYAYPPPGETANAAPGGAVYMDPGAYSEYAAQGQEEYQQASHEGAYGEQYAAYEAPMPYAKGPAAPYPLEPDPDAQATAAFTPAAPEAESTMQYGRPGLWPGAFPFAERQAEPQAEDAQGYQEAQDGYGEPQYYDDPEPYDDPPPAPSPGPEAWGPLASVSSSFSRRRRKLHESVEEAPQYYAPPAPQPYAEPSREAYDQTEYRPARLVTPQANPAQEPPRKGLRTVTGKPVQRKGLFRFAATEDEPIAGLPPLEMEDAFRPPAMPKRQNPDFMPDEE